MKKDIKPKPLTFEAVAGVLDDVSEFLELDAKSYAKEYAPDIRTNNETLLRIYVDAHKIDHTQRVLSQLSDLIKKKNGGA